MAFTRIFQHDVEDMQLCIYIGLKGIMSATLIINTYNYMSSMESMSSTPA